MRCALVALQFLACCYCHAPSSKFALRNWVPAPFTPEQRNASGLAQLLPALDAAPGITEGRHKFCDAAASASSQNLVASLPATRERWSRLYTNRSKAEARALLDELMLDVLPYVQLSDEPDRVLGLDDLVYFGFMLEELGQVPSLHWDNMWACFPKAAGFQLWYMVRGGGASRDRRTWGNMFLAETPDVADTRLPVAYVFRPDGSAQQLLSHGGGGGPYGTGPPIKHHARVSDVDLKWKYLSCSPLKPRQSLSQRSRASSTRDSPH
jgi:hypothetical protein